MNKTILDVFYDILIKEAALGRVDCFFKYNMRFDTVIREDNIKLVGNNLDNNLVVPTLVINNKKEFDSLLVEYVNLALNFYSESCYCDEIRESNYLDNNNKLGISPEKLIITLLWSNATIEDFNDPCTFLKKRISFFELNELEKYLQERIVGYSEILGYDLEIKIVKNGLENETPYALKCYLVKPNGGRIYEFPSVYFGVFDGIGYVYAIQNSKSRLINEGHSKKVDRLLYKVNEGLDVKNDTYDNYGFGNLKDITPNSLVVANILMGLFRLKMILMIITDLVI